MADKPPMDADKVIQNYIKVRDKKAEVTKRHVAEIKPYDEALGIIETKLLMALNASNLESLKGEHGTAFKVVRSSVKIDDWNVALDFVLENDLQHMIERRLSKKAVAEFVEAQGANLPGTHINNELTVQIRRN